MDGCRYNGDRPYMAINLNGARVSLDASSKVGIIDPCRRLLTQLRKSRKLAMVLFTAVVVLLFADHNSLAPNLSAVAEDFGFSDAEKDRYLGGYIAVTFFGLGAPASLLVGCMADIMDRKQLFVGMVIMGQLGALGTIFVRSFWQLLATRAITGLAIGGGIPLLYSLVSDLVDVSRRTEAAGALAIATSLGVASGQALAGFLGRCTSLGWRFPFLLVSVPGLLLSVVVLVATEDPPRSRLERGLQEHFSSGGEYNMRPDRKSLGLLATTPTALMAIFQGIPGCVPGGVFAVYLNDFLHRDRGLTIEQATVVLLTYRLAGVLGQYLGSMVGQRLYNTSPRLQPTLMGVTLMMGTVPSLLIVRYSGGVFGLYVSFSALAGFLLAVTGPNVRSILMNVTLPSTRGTAFGVFNLSDDVGRGLGPAIVSMIVERRGRERAFTNTMAAWVLCGIVLLSMAFTLERDERTVQNFLRDNVRANHREQLDEDLETTLLMNDDKSCGLNEEMGVAYSGNVVENSRVERFS